jgi:CDP-diacylglycerol--glycerol-3-phosphate 3-phosphatidyltransferase
MTDVNPDASNWNLPNLLTAVRIVMVPFFGWALLVDGGDSAGMRVLAWFLFAAAMITDRIDGDIARSRNLVTNFGKVADPIADKALTGMAFVGLSIIGELWWWVTILVLVREWGITLLRFFLLRRGVVVAASSGGKLKTFMQTIALGLLILPLRDVTGAWEIPALVVWWFAVLTMAGAVGITLWTGVQYIIGALAFRRAGNGSRTP